VIGYRIILTASDVITFLQGINLLVDITIIFWNLYQKWLVYDFQLLN